MRAEQAPRPGWYWWAAMLASTLAVGIGSVLISLHINRESDRKWCSVVGTLNSAYEGGTTPATPAGVKLRDGFARLREDLDCPR